ncbi:MAG: SDR family NAD(P)-dependent oxidoreductase [Gammaproteobacteria bacterium]
MKFHKKAVWVTGASSGVGEGLARVFHREGANIIISGRRAAELERVKGTCTEGPGSVHVLPFDLVDGAQRQAAADLVLTEYERLDVLINNAGIAHRSLIKDTLLDVDRRVMEVDFFAPVALTKLVLPRMMAQRDGHVVVTSSVAGKHGMPFHATYCAAKHALHGYFESLRIEMLDYNVRVCLLVIAGIRSNVAARSLTGDGSEYGKGGWGADGMSMSAEECGEKTVAAMLANEFEPVISIEPARQAMLIRQRDPLEFTRRMSALMKWMEKQDR